MSDRRGYTKWPCNLLDLAFFAFKKEPETRSTFIYVANLFILVEYHSEKQNPVFLFSCITSMQSICLKKNHSHTLKRRESDVLKTILIEGDPEYKRLHF